MFDYLGTSGKSVKYYPLHFYRTLTDLTRAKPAHSTVCFS